MSSSTLTIIQTQLTLYGYSISMILGNIGNIFIVIIFNRQPENACAIYLISSAIMNNLYLIFNGCIQIIPFDYSSQTLGAYALCKIRVYLPSVIGQVAKTMLVLACIDRFVITSDRVLFRALSIPKRAKYLIVFSIIFWSLFGIHIPIMVTIVNGRCSTIGIYSAFYSFYTILFIGLIPPTMMSIFGYLTYRNMRQRNVRVQPVTQDTSNTNNIHIRRRDRYLLIIVISEVFVYVLTTTSIPFVLLEMAISQYVIPNKSIQYLQIEGFVLSIAYLLLLINNAASFYIYLIASKSFRRDFKQLIIHFYQKLRR